MTLLEAIAAVESGNNDHAIGKHGEVSRYQFLPKTWAHYTHVKSYSDPVFAKYVADAHKNAITMAFFNRTHEIPAIRDIAAMWQLGFEGYRRKGFNFKKLTKKQQDRCRRIEALTQTKKP